MQEIFGLMKDKAEKLLADGTVNRVIGWKNGEFFYDNEPAVFKSAEDLKGLVYNSFCGANVAKYLIKESLEEGRIAAFIKPCDSYGINELIQQHRLKTENIHLIGVACDGMIDINKIRLMGIKGIKAVKENGEDLIIDTIYGEKTCKKADALLEKCLCCKGKKHPIADEVIGEIDEDFVAPKDRFEEVAKLEAMSPDEKFEFWREELSKCIRCNACRNACPACSCTKCVFDNDKYDVESKANTDTFEENMFHIIRAFHVAGYCTDCGECSRVCPQNIPLHLLNRKFIKDINELYGDYQAGSDTTTTAPLTSYTKEDAEPSIVYERGGDA